ncbi:MAG: alpha-glucosidase C-terminal domain-containing protein [Muribaculaceae bacterium]|nr:alpha-glucosidase C-terminal domain-containing protein [Muribaculaceae bacterium]
MKLKLKKLFLAMTVGATLGSCATKTTQLADDERIPENRVIYEVFVRNFSPEGNLKGVEAQIPRLKDLGVDVVWLMPIYELGDTGLWGEYSSPYSIKNYTKIDPDNGTEQDLRDLVKTIHDNGMEIWFDWVGNHTSMDNIWVSSNPEFYTHKDGDFVHPFGGAWKDVYELDRDNEAMQDEMIKSMQYWVDNFDIDGFRCDYASGPSPELWRKASEQVLKNGKRVAWLAEDASKPSLIKNGYFDYNYCWDFQEKVLKKFANADSLDINMLREACELLANEGITANETKAPDDTIVKPYEGRSRMVYLVNHDVVQDQGGTEDLVYHKYVKPLTVLQFTVYGMPLIYNGQEIQYKSGGRVPISEKTPIDWSEPDTTMTNLIKTLAHLKHTQAPLRTGSQSGKLTNLTTTDDNSIYAYKRTLGDDNVIVLLNFSDEDKIVSIPTGLPTGKFRDAISGQEVDFTSTNTLTVPALNGSVYVKE